MTGTNAKAKEIKTKFIYSAYSDEIIEVAIKIKNFSSFNVEAIKEILEEDAEKLLSKLSNNDNLEENIKTVLVHALEDVYDFDELAEAVNSVINADEIILNWIITTPISGTEITVVKIKDNNYSYKKVEFPIEV